MSVLENFTGRSDGYAKYRPAYPESLYDYLYGGAGFHADCIVADIGAGTGIFTRGLLLRGSRVYAVEPNAEMRGKAKETLSAFANFLPVEGTAENTSLPDHSVDFITAAQAFHWFDHDLFRQECCRILKAGGRAVLVWNSRARADAQTVENDAICRRLCPNYHGFSGGDRDFTGIYARFFKDGRYNEISFDNPLYYDRESFIGRSLSSSYAPRETDGNYTEFVAALSGLFDKYAVGGVLEMRNIARLTLGEV